MAEGILIGTTPGPAQPIAVRHERSKGFEELRFGGDFLHRLRTYTECEVLDEEDAQFRAVKDRLQQVVGEGSPADGRRERTGQSGRAAPPSGTRA